MFNSTEIYRHSLRREERSAEPRLLMSPPPPPPPSTPLSSSGGTKPRSSRLSLSRPTQNRRSSGSVPAADQSPLQQQEAPFQQQQEAPASLPDDDFQVSVCDFVCVTENLSCLSGAWFSIVEFLIRIRIHLFTVMGIRIRIRILLVYFSAGPDPAFPSNTHPDPASYILFFLLTINRPFSPLFC
jgi:hypothetical protein